MGFLSSLFGVSDRTPKTSNVVTSTKLPDELAPFVTDVLGEAQDLYKGEVERGYDPYTGQTIAPLTAEEQQAMAGIAGLAGTTSPFIEEALGTYRQGAEKFTGDVAQQYMSPYQQAVTDIEKREATRNFEGNVLPRLEAQAVQQGAMSGLGSRAGVEFAEAQRNQSQLLADIQAKGQQKAFQDARQGFEFQKSREQQMASNVGRTGPALFQAGLAEQGALQSVGQQKRELGQAALDEAYGKFLEERNFPKQQIADYSSTIYGAAPSFKTGANTATTTSLPGAPSTGQQLLGLGLSGLNIYGAGTAGGTSFSPSRAASNMFGYNKKEGGQVSEGLPLIEAQQGTQGRTLGGLGPYKNFMGQKLFNRTPTKRYQGPLSISKQIEQTLGSQDPEDMFEDGFGKTMPVTDTFDANLADQTGAGGNNEPTPKAKRDYFKETKKALDDLKTEYGVKKINIDDERTSQENVSKSIATEQERFEGEESKMAMELLEKNKKALAEGNEAQIFFNNQQAINKAVNESPTFFTTLMGALENPGAAKLEQDTKKATADLDKEFQKQGQLARGRKSKNLLDKISRDEGIRTRLQDLPQKQMDQFIGNMVKFGSMKEAFAKLGAAEAKSKTDAMDMYIKLARLNNEQAKTIAGDAGVQAGTLPELFRAIMAKAGFSSKVTEEIIRKADNPDTGTLNMGSAGDAANSIKQKAPKIK